MENGTVAPDITILNSLANVLGVSVEEILSGVNTTNKKRRLYNLMNLILTILLVTFIMITCYLYFNKWEVYDFSSDHELFEIDGYVVSNGEDNRYVITNMLYRAKARNNIEVNSVIVELYSGDELVNVFSNDFEKSVPIEDAISKVERGFTNGFINDVDYEDLYIVINFDISFDDDTTAYAIDLNFENR